MKEVVVIDVLLMPRLDALPQQHAWRSNYVQLHLSVACTQHQKLYLKFIAVARCSCMHLVVAAACCMPAQALRVPYPPVFKKCWIAV